PVLRALSAVSYQNSSQRPRPVHFPDSPSGNAPLFPDDFSFSTLNSRHKITVESLHSRKYQAEPAGSAIFVSPGFWLPAEECRLQSQRGDFSADQRVFRSFTLNGLPGNTVKPQGRGRSYHPRPVPFAFNTLAPYNPPRRR